MSNSVFSYDVKDYNRDINPVKHYVEQASFYIARKKGMDQNLVMQKLIGMIKEGEKKGNEFSGLKKRLIKFAERQENGDRVIKKDLLINYINDFVKNGDISAPTLSIYKHPSVQRSYLTDYVINNKKERSKAKAKKFEMNALGRKVEADFFGKIDTNKKIANNSQSGAMSSNSTPLYNKTGHSTLTSGCRNTSSYGNALIEKFLYGNRFYFDLDITLSNITFIVSKINKPELEDIVKTYNLYVPNVEDVFSALLRSTRLYFRSANEEKTLFEFLSNFSPIELTWILYCNSFYDLTMFNQNLIRQFIDEATQEKFEDKEFTPDDIKKYQEGYVIMGHQIFFKELKGLGKRYGEMQEKGLLKKLVPTIENVKNTIEKYSPLLSAFFRNRVPPHNVADFPNSVRRAVLVSDTDSSIFTSQEIVFWYLGKNEFSDVGRKVQSLIVLLISEAVEHLLAMMSAQFNVDKSMLRDIYMKNEYTFDVFVPTDVSKHYYASKSVQEGNVLAKLEREVKGVQLINSALPKFITSKASEMMNEIMDKTLINEKLSLVEYIDRVKDVEIKIKNSILSGEKEFLKNITVKQKSAYTLDNFNAYKHYLFWQEVFAPKYGEIQAPPYDGVKIPTILNNKSSLLEWVNGITDLDVRERLAAWLRDTGRTSLEMLIISKEYINSKGIPEEISTIIDTKSLILELCHPLYMILSTIGYNVKQDYILSEYL